MAISRSSACRVASLGDAVVAAIGPRTAAALEERGVACDVVADDFVAEGLLETLQKRGRRARRRPGSSSRRRAWRATVLPDALRASGAVVDVLPVYDTVAAERLEVPAEQIERADFITFTSSSTVHAVRRRSWRRSGAGRPLAERLAGAALCSIGPVTSETLRELGLPVAVEASEHTAAGLVAAIVAAASGLA